MENTNTQVQEVRRLSNHINHPNCVELRSLLDKIDVTTATVVRGTKNAKQVPLITEKEQELITAFVGTDYNIKKTGEQLGFSHTNVWQRLYGNNKPEKPAKGILGKLRQYAEGGYVTELPVVEEVPAVEGEQATA